MPGSPLYRPEREAMILRRMQAANAGPLSNDAVARIFREIISNCMALEQPLVIAFLGPRHVPAHAAAIKHFGTAPTFEPCPTIDEVFRQVEAGTANYAVVPVVNSTEGFVGRTLDLSISSPLKVCAEIDFRVQQNLMSIETALDGIKKVYCMPSRWRRRQGGCRAICPMPSGCQWPAMPRRRVWRPRRQARPQLPAKWLQRAIACRCCSATSKIRPTTTRASGCSANRTSPPAAVTRTSLILSAPNRPGAVVDLIEPLKRHGVSMSHFESRPHPIACGVATSSLDIEGHASEPKWPPPWRMSRRNRVTSRSSAAIPLPCCNGDGRHGTHRERSPSLASALSAARWRWRSSRSILR